jgi:hypothetical protein
MAAPAAGAYVTISFGQHEKSRILPVFHSQLLHYKSYIEDIFSVWLPPTKNSLAILGMLLRQHLINNGASWNG